jgi:hypothetical protein
MDHLDVLRLDAARAGEATPAEQSHLQSCAECRAAVEGFKALALKLKRQPGPVPAHVDRAILRPPQVLRFRAFASITAALLLAIGLFFLTPSQAPISPRVTILDAYKLALQPNHSEAEVEQLARASVMLIGLVEIPTGNESRFVTVDFYIDSDKPLAAYQFELMASNAKIAGLEGGNVKAFAEAPYYDPTALKGGRIVVAAFTTDENAPKGKIRVARLHLMETGPADYTPKLTLAAQPGGELIHPKLEIVRNGGKK